MNDFEIMCEILNRSSNGIISIYKDLKVIVIDQGFDSAVEINFDADGKII